MKKSGGQARGTPDPGAGEDSAGTRPGGPPRPPQLSIFNTFKTKPGRLTGEAVRQRDIISILASNNNPPENTRTAIARTMAERNGIPWKNIYSGIFKDFDEVLIPLELVREEGRLPLKRGPKALQEKGVPYYGLTQRGTVVALSFDFRERGNLLEKFLKDSGEDLGVIGELGRSAPGLAFLIFENYVRGYCEGRIGELVPFSMEGIKRTQGEALAVYGELLAAFVRMPEADRDRLSDFLDQASHGEGRDGDDGDDHGDGDDDHGDGDDDHGRQRPAKH